MRLLAPLLLLFSTAAAFAQDPTQQILLNQQTQMAVQQAQQIAQQAQQAGQQANDQAMEAGQAALCCALPLTTLRVSLSSQAATPPVRR